MQQNNIHFTALIIYNRVGKCGSRTVVTVIKAVYDPVAYHIHDHSEFPKNLVRFIADPMVSPGREVPILMY